MASLTLAGDTSGQITIAAPAVAGTNTITAPAVTGNMVTTGDNATVTPTMLSQPMTQATAKAYNWNGATNNTVLDFTGIPSWAKRITVMFSGLSTNGTSHKIIQIGSGSFQSTGYVSSSVITSVAVANSGNITTGMALYTSNASSAAIAHMVFTNISSNVWVASHVGLSDSITSVHGGGVVTLSATLDRIRITTVNGTDQFDAGTVNIMYEG